MLKKVLIALAAIVVAFVALGVVVAIQPSEFRVARSAIIFAPAPEVFAHVNDFHNWEAWSPWAKLDPNAKVSFEGAREGEGAIFNWSGNDKVGEGRMTLTESHPNDRIRIQLDFVKPFASTADAEFTFEPAGDQTPVAWAMSGRKNFVSKTPTMSFSMATERSRSSRSNATL